MIKLNDKQFNKLVAEAIDGIPAPYRDHIENVAFIVETAPSPEQAKKLKLACNSLLFGLYEGVPLPARNGANKLLPDKITLFKEPLEFVSQDEADLKARIGNTVWHEVAHYFGLDHKRIHELENK